MIRMLGAMADASERAQQLVGALEARLPVPSQARGFLSSVPHNCQLVSHAAMCLDAVARPDQCVAQMADVFAQTRRVDRLYQEVVAHRVPASSVERLEERPHCRGEHSALSRGRSAGLFRTARVTSYALAIGPSFKAARAARLWRRPERHLLIRRGRRFCVAGY
jgi:hypothetical protein